jgi:hypothetical protein
MNPYTLLVENFKYITIPKHLATCMGRVTKYSEKT